MTKEEIAEAKIMEIKQTEIQDKASESIRKSGWLPDMFRIMQQLMIRVQDSAKKNRRYGFTHTRRSTY